MGVAVQLQQPSAECTAIYAVYCQTPATSLCSDNTHIVHRSTVERIQKLRPHPRPEANALETQQTL